MSGKLFLLGMISIAATGKTILELPSTQRFLSPQGGDEHRYDPSRDPAVGSRFPAPCMDAFGRPIPTSARTVVVIAGGCTSCSLHAIDPRTIVAAPGQTVVFAYQSSQKELQPWMKGLPSSVRVVCDEDLRLQQAANSVWQPRYVVLDDQDRLLDLSRDDAGAPDYLHVRRKA